eukprot:GHVT01015625.1.p1 GENE.GHVT01015625.1~~GHVT01015625.1.p1  ORF type:complete len:218 (+),score=64.16 GHVT01015625.1:1662-2315(+)
MNKPLLIWILLLLPFLLFIFFSRLSIRISSPEEAAAFDAKEFKASITRQMVELFEDLVHANDDMMGAVEEAIHRCGAGVVFTKLSPTTSALLSPWRAQTQELLEQLRALVPGDGFCSRVVNATREFLDAAEALALKCLTTKRTVALTRVADRKRTSAGAAAEQPEAERGIDGLRLALYSCEDRLLAAIDLNKTAEHEEAGAAALTKRSRRGSWSKQD